MVGDDSITIGEAFGVGGNEANSGHIVIHAPSSTNFTYISGESRYQKSDGNTAGTTFSSRRTSGADVDAVRFLMSTGNISSGTFTLYGLASA